MHTEIWKPVIGFEGLYEISSNGNVKHIKYHRILKPWSWGGGYVAVDLYKNGKRKKELVHRLVASAFYPNKSGVVNHINGLKTDNRLENLEWCNTKENLRCYRVIMKKTTISDFLSWLQNDIKTKLPEDELQRSTTLGECLEKIKTIYSV